MELVIKGGVNLQELGNSKEFTLNDHPNQRIACLGFSYLLFEEKVVSLLTRSWNINFLQSTAQQLPKAMYVLGVILDSFPSLIALETTFINFHLRCQHRTPPEFC